jgi:hypothetical protein
MVGKVIQLGRDIALGAESLFDDLANLLVGEFDLRAVTTPVVDVIHHVRCLGAWGDFDQ